MAPGANTLNDRIVAGIDVGGTFTDLIIIDEKAGKVVLAKPRQRRGPV